MINFIYGKVKKFSTWKGIIIFALLFIISLSIINGKPFGVAKLKEYTNGVGILDLEGTYTPEQAYKVLELQGEVGRQFYMRLLIFLDIVFPLTYMIFWSVGISFVFRKWLPVESNFQKLSLIPFIAGLLDYMENISILAMIHYFPERLYNVAVIANIMTILKGIFIEISMLLFVIGLVGLLYKRLTKKDKLSI